MNPTSSQTAQPRFAPPPLQRPRRRRWPWALALAIAVVAAAVLWGRRLTPHVLTASAPAGIPTFRVEPGTVQITAYAKGTLQGGQADRLVAPSIGGDMPRISFLLPAGSEVKPGDVVVRFSTGPLQFQLAQAHSAAAQATANVAAAEDETKAQTIQNTYSLQHAQYDVQLAAIAVKKNPLLAALDARNNLLTLRSARAELQQWQQDIARQHTSDQGLIAIQQAAVSKAQAQAAAAETYIGTMTLRASRAGYVAIEPNPNGQEVLYQGMMLQPFHVGDQVSPGTVIAEIPNLTQLHLQASLSEAGSAYVAPGQAATVQIAGVPGRVFSAHVLRITGTQNQIFSTTQSAGCVLALDGSDPTLRPGMDAEASIVLSALHHVLWVPVEALFQQNGKAIVYGLHNGAFSPHAVHVLRQGATRVAITGVAAGTVVALSDPTDTTPEVQP